MRKSNTRGPSKLIYNWDSLLKRELADFKKQKDVDSYTNIVRGFPIPPANINTQNYLSARNRASFVLLWWKNEWLKEETTIDSWKRAIEEPFIKAALIFEISNFIISIEPWMAQTLVISKNQSKIMKQKLRSSEELRKLIVEFQHQPELFELDINGSLKQLVQALSLLETRMSKNKHTIDTKLSSIYYCGAFYHEATFNPKERAIDFYVSLLTYNISTIFKYCKSVQLNQSYRALCPFFEKAFHHNTSDSKLKDKCESFKGTGHQLIKTNYNHIISHIPVSSVPDSAKDLIKRLGLPEA